MLNSAQQNQVDLNFTPDEINEAMWNILEDKALGLDGLNNELYKAASEIVGSDIVKAVQDYRPNPNTTVITFIPKVANPNTLGDYRPSCCNIINKCISKLICRKLRLVLGSVISPKQGAFVEVRTILHNILLYQDIVKHYG